MPVTTDAPLMQSSRPGSDADGTVVLDREFLAGTLSALREEVLTSALAAGLSRDRSIDVLLAAHEVAANVIRHGSGRGRLRMRVTARVLACQVSDVRAAALPGPAGLSPTTRPATLPPRRPGRSSTATACGWSAGPPTRCR